ncbi:hypothetical protein BDF22DRAFT_778729 [Syncephalis plumigaleata]|nr:hypothetical protein BDF22DRAFT_778729 [Syncephalis plumigaleata]
MEHQKELGLSDIRWCGGDGEKLNLARVTWNRQGAFMKCSTLSNETPAFNALDKAKKALPILGAFGQQNVMDPLGKFEFDGPNNPRYYCYIYGFIDGTPLEDYFKKHTISEAFIITAKILPDIIKGLIYLYNAGVIHGDMLPKNIMVQQGPNGEPIAKIIDFDGTDVFRKEQGWQPLSPNNREHLLPNPIQRYESCDELRDVIANFIAMFVYPNRAKDPFDPKYALAENTVSFNLKKFKQKGRYVESGFGDAKAAIPAMLRLTRAIYTLWHDSFPCSSPMRVLEGQPPRIGTPSRPNSPTF